MFLREAVRPFKSENKKKITAKDMTFGGLYEFSYFSQKDNRNKIYQVYCVHPLLEGKFHALDLKLIKKPIFDTFLQSIRLEDELKIKSLKEDQRPYVKNNVRLGLAFYNSFIKKNKPLISEKPYKTFDLTKLKSIHYIDYDPFVNEELIVEEIKNEIENDITEQI